MLLCTKIKIDVSEQDAATLEFMQGKCRGLYNWWVMRLRAGEKWPGWRLAKQTLQTSKLYDPELKHVYGRCSRRSTFAWMEPCKPSSGASPMGRLLAFPGDALAIASLRSAILLPT